MPRLALVGLLAVAAAVGGWSGAAGQSPTSRRPSSAFQSAEEGAAVYAANCASCHQADGRGLAGAFPPLAGNPKVS